MSMIHTKFAASLMSLQMPSGTKVMLTENSIIHDARNRMVLRALEDGYDTILWLDSDMTFDPDLLVRLQKDAETRDFVTALTFSRTLPTSPVLCEDIIWEPQGEYVKHEAVRMTAYPRDQIFEIGGCGSAACIVRTEIYEQMVDRFHCAPYEPLQHLGEDYSFCWRLKQMGVKMYCDSSIKTGHIGQIPITEYIYESQGPRNG